MTERQCTIDGCAQRHKSRGWCRLHYERFLRTGSTDAPAKPDPTCSVVGCDKPTTARGYCHTHYCRWRNHGHVDKTRATGRDTRGFIRKAVTSGTDACMIWPFSVARNGYAFVEIDGAKRGVHVLVLERTKGAKPDQRLQAAHSCGVRACINPRHLRWATASENASDRYKHGTVPRGSKHHFTILTEADIPVIRSRVAAGEQLQTIAAEYGITGTTVRNIADRFTWGHVGDDLVEAV